MHRDFLYALRVIWLKPSFSLVAILTLALGFGANATIFMFVDVAYLRPLAIVDPDGIVHFEARTKDDLYQEISNPDYLEYRGQSDVFQDLAAVGERGAILDVNGEAESIMAWHVSGNYFSMLGVDTQIGRPLSEEDDSLLATEGTVVISHNLWHRHFGGRSDILGQPIRLNGRSLTVVGVAPIEFRGLDRFLDVSVWIPLNQRPLIGGDRNELEVRRRQWLTLVGRLRPDVSLEEAQAQVTTITERLSAAYPDTYSDRKVTLVPETERWQESVADNGMYLLAMVALVLLIACANVANLMLGHADDRRRTLAMQAALGAGRARLARGVLAQSLVLAAAGGGLGLLLCNWLNLLLPLLTPQSTAAIYPDLQVDGRIVAFVLTMSLVSAFLAGIVPALRSSRLDLVPALNGSEATPGRSRFALRNVLVVSQVALSMVLLSSGGLLLKSFLNSRQIDPGFDARGHLVSFDLVPGFKGYEGQRLHNFYEELRQRLQALPGVNDATYAARLPFWLSGGGRSTSLEVPGFETPSGETLRVHFTLIGPNYFRTLGTELLRGRPVDETDMPERGRVAVINQTMAEKFWPGLDPLGQVFLMGSGRREVRIIGVAEDSRISQLHEEPEPYLFVPEAQMLEGQATFALRLRPGAMGIMGAVKRELAELDPMPVLNVTTIDETMERVLSSERMAAWLVGSLGVLGLVLGAVGLYGVLSLTAARRTREAGIRLALGAGRRDVVMLILGQGMWLWLVGTVIGLIAASGATRILTSRLHGVSPWDPATFALVAALLALVALAACYFPARRAASIDPTWALRYE
jgi:predicted permease